MIVLHLFGVADRDVDQRCNNQRHGGQSKQGFAPAKNLGRPSHWCGTCDIPKRAKPDHGTGQCRENSNRIDPREDVIGCHQNRRTADADQHHRDGNMRGRGCQGKDQRATCTAQREQTRRGAPWPNAIERGADRNLHRRKHQEPQAGRLREVFGGGPDVCLQRRRKNRQEGAIKLAEHIGQHKNDDTQTHCIPPCGQLCHWRQRGASYIARLWRPSGMT